MAGILSVGAAGLDTLTVLDTYPIEDAKVRSKLQVKDGGGNAANTASAISKLGVKSFLISMVGNDIESDKIIGRLNEYAVDTSLTVRTSDSSSGTTFIIVCANTCSRTCIHNPMHSELQLSDIRDMNLDLKPFSLVHFDSRHTLASVEVARMAQQCNKLVTIDIEKMRPHVANLLPFCEIMFTNSVFPTTLLEAGNTDVTQVLNMFSMPWAGKCHTIIATYGARGSLLCRKVSISGCCSRSFGKEAEVVPGLPPDVESIFETCKQLRLVKETMVFRESTFEIMRCPAWPISKDEVLDTTGAGDAYIGGFLAALVSGWQLENCMKLGTLTAAEKLKKYGAREGLPDVYKVMEIVNHL